MLTRLQRALVASAAGRCLAIDLVAVHADRAMEILDAMIEVEHDDVERREILLKAKDILPSLGS